MSELTKFRRTVLSSYLGQSSTRTAHFLVSLIVKLDAVRSPETSVTAYRRLNVASKMIWIFIYTAGISRNLSSHDKVLSFESVLRHTRSLCNLCEGLSLSSNKIRRLIFLFLFRSGCPYNCFISIPNPQQNGIGSDNSHITATVYTLKEHSGGFKVRFILITVAYTGVVKSDSYVVIRFNRIISFSSLIFYKVNLNFHEEF